MVQRVGGSLVVRLSGELTGDTAPRVRTALLEALAERPDAVVADLADLRVRQRHAAAVFAAVVQQAAMWPGVPLLLCAPDEQTARLLTWGGWLPVFASVEQALSAPARRRKTLICD